MSTRFQIVGPLPPPLSTSATASKFGVPRSVVEDVKNFWPAALEARKVAGKPKLAKGKTAGRSRIAIKKAG